MEPIKTDADGVGTCRYCGYTGQAETVPNPVPLAVLLVATLLAVLAWLA
jgi:hypothetical protein